MIRKLFKVGELIENSGLSRQMVHYYTQLGLINEARRTPAGHRLYKEDVFKRIKRIKTLQSKGMTLLEIKKVINGGRID
ncbi:MerR family transcriptional regulator [Candidatus Omnitrophota bacterium]